MELAFDTETYKKDETTGKLLPILDGTGKYFIAGSIVDDKGNKKVFYNKEEMWNWIIEKGKKARKNGKCIYAWAHNIKYDFYNIFKEEKGLVILAENPFIAIYYITQKKEIPIEKWENYKLFLTKSNRRYTFEKKENYVKVEIQMEAVRFLDSMNLFKMALKEVGNLIGLEKLSMPLEIENIEKLKELETYVLRDSEIVLEGIKMLKEKIRNDGIKIKRIMTINQIAIAYILKEMKRLKTPIFNGIGEKIIQSKYRKIIRKAYRGGRVEIFNLGEDKIGTEIKNVCKIDTNSLYPYASTQIKFPDLKTETLYKNPEKKYWNNLLNKIGISRAMLYNKNNSLGLLPVRLPTFSYFPKRNTYLIGTWTNEEIKTALQEGYELINIEYSIIYDEIDNPFKTIMTNLFKKRTTTKEKGFDYHYYKSMMNNGLGKFGQIRTGQEIIFDNIDQTKKYVKENYINLGGISDNSETIKWQKKPEKQIYKNYYSPLLIALVTAKARLIMYEIYKKLENKLIYTDTDDAVFIGQIKDIKNKINLGDKMGELKIDFENGYITAYGRKSTERNGEIKMSGISKSNLVNIDKEKGKIKYKNMQGIKKENIGEFEIHERDLKKQVEEYNEQERIIREQKIFIDNDIIEDIKNNDDKIEFFANEILKAGIKNNEK